MAGWLQALVITVIGGGGVAIGAGMYQLGSSLGEIAATLDDLDRRVTWLENERSRGRR